MSRDAPASVSRVEMLTGAIELEPRSRRSDSTGTREPASKRYSPGFAPGFAATVIV